LSEQQLVHFFEGDSRLTPWGRQVMGMFCADELRFLSDAKSTLSIFAYADPEGSDESNQTLSDHRAMNTMHGLVDIVSPQRVRTTIGVVEGMGELPARVRGHVQNGAEDPRWRRVDVILDNHVLLELHVPKRP
jgi:outer membrane protein OmpA-like peptidoglycan-associated protein